MSVALGLYSKLFISLLFPFFPPSPSSLPLPPFSLPFSLPSSLPFLPPFLSSSPLFLPSSLSSPSPSGEVVIPGLNLEGNAQCWPESAIKSHSWHWSLLNTGPSLSESVVEEEISLGLLFIETWNSVLKQSIIYRLHLKWIRACVCGWIYVRK